MSSPFKAAAVDLGAASGRVITAVVDRDRLELTEVARFANTPRMSEGALRWDIRALYAAIEDGLRKAGPVDSIGIDSWAVDYGLLDPAGVLLRDPVHYRDSRTDGVMAEVLGRVPADRLYATTGLQLLPFNTLFQLAAERFAELTQARTLLLIPDLIAYWLTGEIGAERTNASTTQLLDIHTGQWSSFLSEAVGVPDGLLPPLRDPGTVIGRTKDGVTVTAVGSHDTASAVVGVPAADRNFAYLSCGTWSLVGVELDAPVLTEASRVANFTNEAGVDGKVRYLRNVMGLWLIQECLRAWPSANLEELLREAAQVEPLRAVVNADDPVFLPPGDMPGRVSAACAASGQPIPETPAQIVRCLLDSLALAHRNAVDDARRLSGQDVDILHIVGGGARNDLLCQLTADACDLPVLAGPVEATALGNVLVQARAHGAIHGELASLRHLVRTTQPTRSFTPRGTAPHWAAAAARLG